MLQSGDILLKENMENGNLFFCGIPDIDKILDGLEGGSTLLISGPSLPGKTRVASYFCAGSSCLL